MTVLRRLLVTTALFASPLAGASPSLAQTAPPAPPATSVPWQPRPVIIIDPRRYLPSPAPRPHARKRPAPNAKLRRPLHRATPHAQPTPEVFERHDTAPPPTTPTRGR